MFAIFWGYIYLGYQLDVLKMFHSKKTYRFPEKSHECALKLTDLWITSLLFVNLLMGASLLALAKSIYYL